jgi:hypothetical protein
VLSAPPFDFGGEAVKVRRDPQHDLSGHKVLNLACERPHCLRAGPPVFRVVEEGRGHRHVVPLTTSFDIARGSGDSFREVRDSVVDFYRSRH